MRKEGQSPPRSLTPNQAHPPLQARPAWHHRAQAKLPRAPDGQVCWTQQHQDAEAGVGMERKATTRVCLPQSLSRAYAGLQHRLCRDRDGSCFKGGEYFTIISPTPRTHPRGEENLLLRVELCPPRDVAVPPQDLCVQPHLAAGSVQMIKLR